MADSENYLQAQLAYKITKAFITTGRGNKFDSAGLATIMNFAGLYIGGILDYIIDDDNNKVQIPSFIQAADRRGRNYHAGNCEEHTAVPFMSMYRKGVRPIGYVQAPECTGNHAFAVVGPTDTLDQKKAETWGDDCWICDPWLGKVFSSKNYYEQAYKSRSIVPIWRCWVG